ncbi:septum formation initiator family protein [Myxococcota bacterium]|nr:septum formation initiator family protein [Myxococcota bacterium]
MTTESPLVRRLLWNLLPIAVVVGAVTTTLIGEEGVLNRTERKQRLYALRERVEQVERDNDRLRAEVRALKEDPRAIRREAAQQLMIAPEGSTIYRLDSPSTD